jgi:hypothetical protein
MGFRREVPGSGRESASGARGSRRVSALNERGSSHSSGWWLCRRAPRLRDTGRETAHLVVEADPALKLRESRAAARPWCSLTSCVPVTRAYEEAVRLGCAGLLTWKHAHRDRRARRGRRQHDADPCVHGRGRIAIVRAVQRRRGSRPVRAHRAGMAVQVEAVGRALQARRSRARSWSRSERASATRVGRTPEFEFVALGT